MRSTSIEALLLLASTCLPTFVLAATLPSRSTPSWQPKALQWKSCGAGVPKTVDCATLAVPLNWADTTGPTINLALARLRATDNSSAANLVINPGGPGGSGTENIVGLASDASVLSVSDKLRSAYNLIGPDPRGIGLSNPIKCDIDLWNQRISRYPQTEADFNKLVQHNKALGESCLKLSGNILKHVDTLSVARDFEAIRQALGDKKLNFLAFSYGTQIAAQYAGLFPQNTGKFVLDGNTDHSGSETYSLVTEVATYEKELVRFAQWCGSSKSCALHGKDVATIFDKLVKQADETPIPALGCDGKICRKDVNGEELRFNTQGYLIFKPISWPILGLGLAQALKGNATLLSTPYAVAGQAAANSGLWAMRTVGCLDWFHSSTDVSDILYKQQLTATIAPHTLGASEMWDEQVSCIGWPSPIQNPPEEVKIPSSVVPMLQVNALYDPETSYTWAVALNGQIPNAVLLTRNGDGHTSYPLGGETQALCDDFLVDGKMPAQNTVVDT